MMDERNVSRRDILKMGSAGVIGLAGSYFLNTFGGLTPAVHAATHSQKNHQNMNHSNDNVDVSKSEGYLMAEKLLTTLITEKLVLFRMGKF